MGTWGFQHLTRLFPRQALWDVERGKGLPGVEGAVLLPGIAPRHPVTRALLHKNMIRFPAPGTEQP